MTFDNKKRTPMKRETFQARRQSVCSPSGSIGYVEGAVTLFVHGVIVNSYLWRHQLVDLFAERRSIAVDLLGYGRTEVKNLAAR